MSKETLRPLALQNHESTQKQLVHKVMTDYKEPIGHF